MPIEKILVLEDDLIVRRNLEQLLRQQRYDVTTADSLAAARDALGRDTFDLLFMDLLLPDGEGTRARKTSRGYGHGFRLGRIRGGMHAQWGV